MTPIASRVLIDTGPLVALLSDLDQYREECRVVGSNLPIPAYTCWPVVTEVAHLLRKETHRRHQFLAACDGSRFEMLPLDTTDLPRVNAILAKYEDQSFDLADACLMHLAEREGIDHVFTLDRRHFSVFRTSSGHSLTILPVV